MHKRVTITIDEDVLALAEARVARGEARSLSAFISQATEARVRKETLSEFAQSIMTETGQRPTPEDEEWARQVLAP